MIGGRAERTEALYRLAFAALSLACVWPLFYVRYAPIEDLPQHLAAVRVLHDFHDPRFGFDRFFELDLWRTQYLAYYLAVDLLAYVVPLELANKLLLAAAMVGIPLAARSLRQALGKDGSLALLLFPLAYNAHLILGFFNFIAAIGLALYCVSLAVQQRRSFSHARAVAGAVLAMICFYTHVVPFALMALAIVLAGSYVSWRAALRSLITLVPAGLCAIAWAITSPAGRATLAIAGQGAGRGAEAGAPVPVFTPAAHALHEIPLWLTDVLQGDRDLWLLEAWAGLALLAFALGIGERIARRRSLRAGGAGGAALDVDAHSAALSLRLWLLPLVSAALYFVTPTSYDWIWPIAPRFPLLCATWLVIALPSVRFARHVLSVLAIVVSSWSFHLAGKAFTDFDRHEVGDFDRALAAIPDGQRVVGLIFDRGSHHVAFSPFIHFVAYYQARKGGAVMFTFADFPQSPFVFRDDNRPPRVPPRWEWLPERVRPRTDLAFYDYALVRAGPGVIARSNSGFTPLYRGERWSVWKHAR